MSEAETLAIMVLAAISEFESLPSFCGSYLFFSRIFRFSYAGKNIIGWMMPTIVADRPL